MCYRTEKNCCLQVYLCTIQPRNFTGWGSEGVKTKTFWPAFFCLTVLQSSGICHIQSSHAFKPSWILTHLYNYTTTSFIFCLLSFAFQVEILLLLLLVLIKAYILFHVSKLICFCCGLDSSQNWDCPLKMLAAASLLRKWKGPLQKRVILCCWTLVITPASSLAACKFTLKKIFQSFWVCRSELLFC